MKQERRQKPLSPKELAQLREEKEKERELSPGERQRRFIVNFGVGLLLLAFITSSGIMCINPRSMSAAAGHNDQQQNGKAVDPIDGEIARYEKELEGKPNDPATLANLAFFHLERGEKNADKKEVAQKDYDEATKQLDAALKVNPEYSFALRLSAMVKMREDKLDQAKTQLDLAHKASQKPVDPKDPEKEIKENNAKADQVQARLALADLARRSKDYKGSISQLDEAIKLDGGNIDAYSLRAEALLETKQPEAARKDLNTVMQIAQAMPPSTATMMAARRAQMILQAMDAGNSPTPSASPKASASATPAAAAPTPAATP